MPQSTQSDEPISLRRDPAGFLRLAWVPGSHIDERLGERAMSMVNELCGAQPAPLMVDMTATAALSRGARKVFTRPCAASRIALVGRSPVDRVIANFALGVSSVPVPTRFFTAQDAAIAWLCADAGRVGRDGAGRA